MSFISYFTNGLGNLAFGVKKTTTVACSLLPGIAYMQGIHSLAAGEYQINGVRLDLSEITRHLQGFINDEMTPGQIHTALKDVNVLDHANIKNVTPWNSVGRSFAIGLSIQLLGWYLNPGSGQFSFEPVYNVPAVPVVRGAALLGQAAILAATGYATYHILNHAYQSYVESETVVEKVKSAGKMALAGLVGLIGMTAIGILDELKDKQYFVIKT